MLLNIDGFDYYTTADLTKRFSSISGSPTISSSAGRRSGGALSTSSSATVTKTLPAAVTSFVWGAAVRPSTLATSSAPTFVRFLDAGTAQLELRFNLDGTVSVLRNGTLLSTSGATIPVAAFNYIEFKATINDTTGSYELRLNGSSITSGSGVDTKNTANASITQYSMGYSNAQAASVLLWDDHYFLDTTGSDNNNFLGDCRIDTLFPTSDGNYTQFTPSTGSSHFALVDETAPNTTDYNESATVGQRDSYGLQNLTPLVAGDVFGVQVNAAVLKDDAGARSASTFVRSGTTNGDGTSASLSTSQTILAQIYEKNPDGTVDWTVTSINAMEAGLRVSA